MSKHARFLALLLLAVLAAGSAGMSAEEHPATDTQAPSLLTFDMQPRQVNCGIGPKQVLISAYLLDTGSGVSGAGDMQIQLRSPKSTSFAGATFYHLVADHPDALVEGDIHQGLWQVAVTIPQNAEEGTWELEDLFLVDQAGNYQVLTAQDLQAFGFASTIDVRNTATSLDLPLVLLSWTETPVSPTPSPSPTVPVDLPPMPPR